MKKQDLHTMICEAAQRLGLGDIISHAGEYETIEADPAIIRAFNARLTARTRTL